jgi:hypothetical protein
MGAACLKSGGVYLFLYPKRRLLERDLKERGAKYRNYSTSIPSSPFLNMLQERGQLQGLMYCMLCTW